MRRIRLWLEQWSDGPYILLAAVCYVPLLFTSPGEVGADTKSYLYLDPGRLLADAPYLWDSGTAAGTVTHQTIGYLFPIGPYYWLMDTVGVPDWLAQRLWLGSVMLLAGLGVRYLLRTLRWQGSGMAVASFAYALSPYIVHYAARISVILLPFAGLPWLIALAVKSLREGGWRYPALFALTVQLVGGVNATSLLLVGFGPVLWFVHATFIAREVDLREALATAARIAVLTVATSAWWIAGLYLQGQYGIDVLRYTETYEVVADAAVAPELLRGLGYWFFYGNDKLGPWIEASVTYTESVPAIALSYLLPILAFTAAVVARWRHRIFFVLLLALGTFLSVGAHPFDSPSPFGALFKAWTETDTGLAFRSTPRAVPLIVLSTAVFLGAGVAALGRRLPGRRVLFAAVAITLVVANLSALWLGRLVDRNLERDEHIPEYWEKAAAYLDEGDHGTRLLELPGIDFASYRWGNTVDPITPGLIDRGYLARELIPFGSPASADLLNAVDLQLQEGRFDATGFADLARLLAVGEVVLRNDLQFERYRTPRPVSTYAAFLATPGLTEVATFGDPVANVPVDTLPLLDEVELGTPDELEDPAPVTVFGVDDPLPIVRPVPVTSPQIVDGNGAGLVDVAAAGLLDPQRALFYAATFAADPEGLDALLRQDAQLVITDENRREARRWGAVRENDGYTEQAGEEPLVVDHKDNRLPLFPEADDSWYTVSDQRGGVNVAASAYGNPVTFTPGDRAALAMDGDPATAWRVGAFDEVLGEFLRIETDEPVTTDEITFLQPQLPANRWITEVRLTFDGGEQIDVELDDSSRVEPGQVVSFPEQTFSRLDVEIIADSVGPLTKYDGKSGVGFAEVGVADLTVDEVIRLPTGLLDSVGGSAIDHFLSYVFTRQRANPSEPVLEDEEDSLIREFELFNDRAFDVTGTARLSADIPDAEIDRLLGTPSADSGGVTATSGGRLPGDPSSRASKALDGDPATAWQSPVSAAEGNWLDFEFSEPISFDRLDLAVIADGRHSVPTKLTIHADGEPVTTVAIPEISDGSEQGHVQEVQVDVGPVSGTDLRFTFEEVRSEESLDWYSGGPTILPLGVAEIGLGEQYWITQPSAEIDPSCREGLLSIDGVDVALSIEGTVAEAEAREPLGITACNDAALDLTAGTTTLETRPGDESGFDIDQVAITSAAGGGPAHPSAAPAPGPVPRMDVDAGRATYSLDVDGADEPFWLVLGESYNEGWSASVDGMELGPPTLINGYANGWFVDPAGLGLASSFRIEVSWPPQRIVWLGIGIALAASALCVALVVWRPRFLGGASIPTTRVQPADPFLISPFDGYGAPPATSVLVWYSAVAFGAAALLIGPIWGPIFAAVTAFGLSNRAGWVLVRALSVGSLLAAALYVVARQYRNGFPADFEWPQNFEAVHILGLLAAGFLVVEAVIEAQRAGWRREVEN
ncbi:MAG: Alpha-(1-_3)-arabinofuranosyltransferase [Acidimicrobiales bacterium]|nr:MAG: DUF3367 domain-containing protein [Actinomycetota bacterium]MBV6508257.1 Alpha-(1->3)-arabinofuranosyltransferase [Acidimicrobiales bacterium]RIK07328.1 MAG: DUF3367 domain-containing protein [Acidobacteriota bacterium]